MNGKTTTNNEAQPGISGIKRKRELDDVDETEGAPSKKIQTATNGTVKDDGPIIVDDVEDEGAIVLD